MPAWTGLQLISGDHPMFALFSRRIASTSSVRTFQVETLENRQFLSVSSIASDVLTLDARTPMAAESTSIVRIRGIYSGKYNIKGVKEPLTFEVTKCTHTGHFTGTVQFTLGSHNYIATLKGVIRSNLHLDISFNGGSFTGTMTGIASHTGGSFAGDYTVTGAINTSGTYHAAKA
jgi:hypothetical protein